MSKIAIISQPDQGVLIDVSGCTTLQEAVEHLSATLQVSSQFWKGMNVSLNLGKLDLATREIAQILALAKGVGIAPRATYSRSDVTKSSLNQLGMHIGEGEPMSLPNVSFRQEDIGDAELEGQKKKKSPFASIKLRVADAINSHTQSRKAANEKPVVEEPLLEDMESVGGPLRDPFDTSPPVEKNLGAEIVPQQGRVKTTRRVSLDGRKLPGKAKNIDTTTEVSPMELRRGVEPSSSDSDIQASVLAANEASNPKALATLEARSEHGGREVTPLRAETSEPETSEGISGAPYVVDGVVESREFISAESALRKDLVATESDGASDALSEIEEDDIGSIANVADEVKSPVVSDVDASVAAEPSNAAESSLPTEPSLPIEEQPVSTAPSAAIEPTVAVEPMVPSIAAEVMEPAVVPEAKPKSAKKPKAELENTADVTEEVKEIAANTADGASHLSPETPGDELAESKTAVAVAEQVAGNLDLEEEWDEESETTEDSAEQESEVPSVTVGQATLYLRQTLRSGQTVSHKGHLVIVGDINPGAEVLAEGDITVWGSLRGVAHAGVGGNVHAEIRALKLQPIQIRIANAIARAPDRPRVKSAANVVGPETARMVGGKIRVFRSRID